MEEILDDFFVWLFDSGYMPHALFGLMVFYFVMAIYQVYANDKKEKELDKLEAEIREKIKRLKDGSI